ncbi:DUF4876 domain-containing protein [candidate division KSB1 bacterium]|nr:DUF4876 domain-containing protein [candidate division KSB1 bacterium]MBL7094795.1 DUF4876 domain-containing protein [candidate division KSB1 bacterium]
MKNFVLIFLFLIFIFGILDCSLKKPTGFDGECKIHILVIDTTGTVPLDSISGLAPVANAKVQLYSQEYDIKYTSITDDNGETEIENLLASQYVISVSKKIPAELLPDSIHINKDVLLTGTFEKTIYQNQVFDADTVKLGKKLLSKIIINEIYYCGSSSNNGTYQYDQFVELYNASDTVQYLDGLIIARASVYSNYINQYAEAMYLYQFPGTGKDFPVVPGEHVVVAQDAIDHITGAGADSSLDLSYAHWEFYNQYGDIDNPHVPNLENINPNKQNDFLLHIKYGGVFLINGKEVDQFNFTPSGYVLFSFKDVMDAVEYSRDPGNPKIFTGRLDAGIAGIGLQKYSGKSIERKNPIDGAAGHDTDNSSLDFKIVHPPTPGYQH